MLEQSKESDNYIRKEYIKRSHFWNEFPKEQFAISRQLSYSQLKGYWGNPKYGPIPEGKLISICEGKGKGSYILGYRDVKYFRWEDVPPKSLQDVYNPRKKKVYYTFPMPYYREYDYRNSISTYSIGYLSSIFMSYKWFNVNCLNGIANNLNAKGIPFTYNKVGNKDAIKYSDKDGKITRVITFANGNAYMLETEANDNQTAQSDLLCSSISLNHFQILRGGKIVSIMLCLLIIGTIIVISFYSKVKRKIIIGNRYAYTFFILGIISIFVSFIIAMYQSYLLYTSSYVTCSSVFILAGCLFTIVFITTPLCIYYYRKSKEKWRSDYIVPSILKRAHYDLIHSAVKRKWYVSCVCYPLMVLSLLPCGIYLVLLISVPLLFICTGIIWFIKWQNWVKGSKVPENIMKK